MKLEIKVTETSPPACYLVTDHIGSEGQHLCARPIYGGQRFDACWQCVYGERTGIRVNG